MLGSVVNAPTRYFFLGRMTLGRMMRLLLVRNAQRGFPSFQRRRERVVTRFIFAAGSRNGAPPSKLDSLTPKKFTKGAWTLALGLGTGCAILGAPSVIADMFSQVGVSGHNPTIPTTSKTFEFTLRKSPRTKCM